jgi:hypothetical protein
VFMCVCGRVGRGVRVSVCVCVRCVCGVRVVSSEQRVVSRTYHTFEL